MLDSDAPLVVLAADGRLLLLADLAHDQVLRVVDENRRLQSLVTLMSKL